VIGWDLLATQRASTDLIQIVLHTGLVEWALLNSSNPPQQLIVNVLIWRPLALRVAYCGTLLSRFGIRGMWMLGNELAPQVRCPSVVMAYVTGT
jgi:hypothetical protein